MPPRFAYWTIILDGTPTSFRAKEQAELLPTFNQLKKQDPGALMKWFSAGTLWDSPEQASEKRRLDREQRYNQTRSREERRRDEFSPEGQSPDQGPNDDRVRDSRPGSERPRGGPSPFRRPSGVRPNHAGPRDGRPNTDRPRDARPGSDRPRDVRPHDQRPRDERPRDDRPTGERPPEQRGPAEPPAAGDVKRKPRTLPRIGSAGAGTGLPVRPKGWRPGGDHKDPKDKYKLPPGEARKRWKKRNLGAGKPKP